MKLVAKATTTAMTITKRTSFFVTFFLPSLEGIRLHVSKPVDKVSRGHINWHRTHGLDMSIQVADSRRSRSRAENE